MKKSVFILIFSLFSFISIISADEWDIFNNEESSTVDKQQPEPISVTQNIETGAGYQILRSTRLASADENLLGYKAFFFSFIYDLDIKAQFQHGFNVSFDCTLTASDKEIGNIAEYQNYDNLSIAYFALNEVLLHYSPFENLLFDLGLLPLNIGNGLLFNPVNYLNRFIPDSTLAGSSSFPGLQASFFYNQNMLRLTYIGYQADVYSFLNKYVPNLFQTDYNSHVLYLQSNHLLAGQNLSLLGFLELTRESIMYFGFGTEAQLPLFDFMNFDCQALFSNGLPGFSASSLDSIYFLNRDSNESEQFFWDVYTELDLTLFSKMMLKIGYLFNQRGLSHDDFSKITASLGDKVNPFYSVAKSSAIGFAYSPLPFMEHLAVIGFIIPEVVEGLNISLFDYMSIFDFSFKLLGNITWQVNEILEIELNPELNWGNDSTYFGLGAVSFSCSAAIHIAL